MFGIVPRLRAASLLAPLLACALVAGPRVAMSADLVVMTSGGFAAPYRALAPAAEAATGHHLTVVYGPSMGDTPNTIPTRLARGERADILVMVGAALDKLIKAGKASDRVDIAHSWIGMAVRAGAPVPAIGTVEEFKKTLLAAKSIAYSDSASGVYIGNTLFHRLGLAEQLAARSHMIPADPVGGVVAKGEAEIGFQQISELKPIAGITLVGKIPAELQLDTIYAAAIPTGSHEKAAAKQVIAYFASSAAAPIERNLGLDPIVAAR